MQFRLTGLSDANDLQGPGFEPFLFGCLYSTNKRVELSEDEPAYIYVDFVRLVGTFAGFVSQDGYDLYEFACAARIRVVDLRDGKRLRKINVLGSNNNDSCQQATSFELADNGSVAWITPSYRGNGPGSQGHPPEVWAADGRGRRLLDSSALIADRSLTLTGSTVSWLKAGVRHSATLY